MNILEQIKKIPGGASHIAGWLGSGGNTCSRDEAQSRADICNKGLSGNPCPHNQRGLSITKETALAAKALLEIKSGLNLRVNGEKSLFHCSVCTCVLRLQIWETKESIKSSIDQNETFPDFCWKHEKNLNR